MSKSSFSQCKIFRCSIKVNQVAVRFMRKRKHLWKEDHWGYMCCNSWALWIITSWITSVRLWHGFFCPNSCQNRAKQWLFGSWAIPMAMHAYTLLWICIYMHLPSGLQTFLTHYQDSAPILEWSTNPLPVPHTAGKPNKMSNKHQWWRISCFYCLCCWLGASFYVCSGGVSCKIPISGLAISEMHQHLYNLSQQLVDLLRRIYCCFGISKSVSCSSLLVATAAGAIGSFHGCWSWCSMWRIGSASTHVAPWSRLADTSDQILCLVALSLTHINNIWVFEWLVVLVEGKRESHFGTITGDCDCDCWILAQSWYWVFVWMYFIIVHVWIWPKGLENHSTIFNGAQKKHNAVSMRSWGSKRHAPRACCNLLTVAGRVSRWRQIVVSNPKFKNTQKDCRIP